MARTCARRSARRVYQSHVAVKPNICVVPLSGALYDPLLGTCVFPDGSWDLSTGVDKSRC